ncbi:MAG TPA: hypothetical protein VMT93_07615 [Gemmatimonadaceae bacterium]|nr:hypothetical protein [Gemmatimonadaceae bacterium]
MSRPTVRWRHAAALAALFAAACAYPTDNSGGAFVTVNAPEVLIRGGDTLVTAHVYLVQHGSDTVEVKNVVVTWTASNAGLATVTPVSAREARVTGLNPGLDTITAVAPTLQSARFAMRPIRIANPLEMDSVSPHGVSFGQQITLYGVGAATADLLVMNSVQLISNDWSGTNDTATGTGTHSFWVEHPAHHIRLAKDTLIAVGNGIVTARLDSIAIDNTKDFLDSFPAAPSHIDIDGRPFHDTPHTVPDVRDFLAFYNPALFAEDPGVLPFKFDWYRFTTAHPDSAYTFIYSAPSLLGQELTVLSAPASAANLLAGGWSYGSGHYNCKGNSFTVAEVPTNTFAAAFTRLPPGGVDFVSLFVNRGTYLLAVVHGFATYKNLPADRYEGDNTCDLADTNFTKAALHIDLTSPFADTLNIENAFDIDWLRFHVPGAGPQTVTVKLHSKSYDQPAVNPSDVVLYVTNVPSTPTSLTVLGSALTGGNTKSLTLTLSPGDYYLVAHDSVGVPGRYSVCMAIGASCALITLPDAAPAASGAAAPDVVERVLAPARKRRTPR